MPVMSEEETPASDSSSGEKFEAVLKGIGFQSEMLMDVLELLTALIMVVLFAIGVYDLGLKVFKILATGTYTDPNAVVKVIDTALLLLIIVEIYRTVIAYVEDKRILPIVLNVAVIAMARKIISFRTGKYATQNDALMSAFSYGFLMVIVILAFYLIHRLQEQTDFNIYTASDNED